MTTLLLLLSLRGISPQWASCQTALVAKRIPNRELQNKMSIADAHLLFFAWSSSQEAWVLDSLALFLTGIGSKIHNFGVQNAFNHDRGQKSEIRGAVSTEFSNPFEPFRTFRTFSRGFLSPLGFCVISKTWRQTFKKIDRFPRNPDKEKKNQMEATFVPHFVAGPPLISVNLR